jgi:hypothetical protein
MAHVTLPLENGVLDGINQAISHTLLQVVNYARIKYPPHEWCFRDLATSPFAWQPHKEPLDPTQLPFALQKMQFQHQYSRNAFIYLRPSIPRDITPQQEFERIENWTSRNEILSCIRLLYASTEPLTPGEMDGSDVEDIPSCVLFKAVIEYRSLPATGNQQAVQAEELSMLSFGGSIDDDVKYGALASLYDPTAKYVLEIYSVRGKKYKFDLMDAVLSDRTLPMFAGDDPSFKSCCVTVADHQYCKSNEENCSVSRIHLTMEGKPRQYAKGVEECFREAPLFNYMVQGITNTFLYLNPFPPLMATATPSGHTLLLDEECAGSIYINGRFVTRWGADCRIGSHGDALFGMDLHSVPFLNGRIVDFEALKHAYALLWSEVLVDAKLFHLHVARRLLYRLMKGHDPPGDEDVDELYETESEDELPGYDSSDVHVDCLESQVLAAPQYDVVGIAAKALATRFAIEFGKNAFPCLSHEVEWVGKMLPDRASIVVPQRLINILRRGGYFDTKKTFDLLWFGESRPAQEGEEFEVLKIAVECLENAGCCDVDMENVVFTSSPVAENVLSKDAVCRYNSDTEQFFVHHDFFKTVGNDVLGQCSQDANNAKLKGYFLGFYIAKAHPMGKLLPKYVLCNRI